jgi:hypothetical protein
MRPRLSRVIMAVVTASTSGGVAACDLFEPNRDCLLLPCRSSLTVRFSSSLPPGPVTVELLPLGTTSSTRYVVECTDGALCPVADFPGFFLEQQVQVRVTTTRGNVVRLARPTYQRSQPNGPDCEPTCLEGTVTVDPP